MSTPTVRFAKPATVSSTAIAAQLTWTASDAGSGLVSFVISRSVDGGAPTTVANLGAAARSLTTTMAPNRSYAFSVRAIDAAGNDTTASASLRPVLFSESTALGSYAGTWRSMAYSNAIGGKMRYATTIGASTTFRFTGREVALVAPVGPTRGTVKVYLDGVYKATVSLYATTLRARQLVLDYAWPTSARHTIKLVLAGPSGRSRVDIDSWLVGS
jgi:hypothetical protein